MAGTCILEGGFLLTSLDPGKYSVAEIYCNFSAHEFLFRIFPSICEKNPFPWFY